MVSMPGVGGFSLPSSDGIMTVILLLFAFLLAAICMGVGLLFFLVKRTQRKVIEIDMCNRKMKIMSGRLKKNKNSGHKQFWIGRLRKFLPQLSGEGSFSCGSKDAFILLKDKNGLHHSTRLPTYEELKQWYIVAHNIDLDNPEHKTKYGDRLRETYLLPNPHEDLDWLANQVAEANKEFSLNHWWQSPMVAYVAVGFICFITWVATLVIAKKM